jgi:hypothetical protein
MWVGICRQYNNFYFQTKNMDAWAEEIEDLHEKGLITVISGGIELTPSGRDLYERERVLEVLNDKEAFNSY